MTYLFSSGLKISSTKGVDTIEISITFDIILNYMWKLFSNVPKKKNMWDVFSESGIFPGMWDVPRDVCLECGIFPVMCVWSVGFSQ